MVPNPFLGRAAVGLDTSAGRLGRRSLLKRTALVAGAGASRSLVGRGAAGAPLRVPETMRRLGNPILSPEYGFPSRHEAGVVRRPTDLTPTQYSSWSFTPLEELDGIVTPAGLFFERHHAGVPDIAPDAHQLVVHGLVKRPLLFTMDDLVRFPAVSRFHFLECSGNGSAEWKEPRGKTVQFTHGLLSCCEWTGVPLATVLDEAGLAPGAKRLVPEGGGAGGEVAARGRRRCGSDDAQHPHREGARRRAAGLCTKRRTPPPRARLSPAPAPPRVRGQHEREMAAPDQDRRRAVLLARGDLQVHRPPCGGPCARVQLRDGGEIGHHPAVRRQEAADGVQRDSRPGGVWEGPDRARRCLGRWRQELAEGLARRAGAPEVPHPLPPSLELAGRARAFAEPVRRRYRVCAAQPHATRRRAWTQFLLPQQFNPELARRGGRRGDECPRVSGGRWASRCSSSPARPFPRATRQGSTASASRLPKTTSSPGTSTCDPTAPAFLRGAERRRKASRYTWRSAPSVTATRAKALPWTGWWAARARSRATSP